MYTVMNALMCRAIALFAVLLCGLLGCAGCNNRTHGKEPLATCAEALYLANANRYIGTVNLSASAPKVVKLREQMSGDNCSPVVGEEFMLPVGSGGVVQFSTTLPESQAVDQMTDNAILLLMTDLSLEELFILDSAGRAMTFEKEKTEDDDQGRWVRGATLNGFERNISMARIIDDVVLLLSSKQLMCLDKRDSMKSAWSIKTSPALRQFCVDWPQCYFIDTQDWLCSIDLDLASEAPGEIKRITDLKDLTDHWVFLASLKTGVVLCIGPSGAIAVNLMSTSRSWKLIGKDVPGCYSPPAVGEDGSIYYVGELGRDLVRVGSDGRILSRIGLNLSRSFVAPVIDAGGTVFVAGEKLVCISETGGIKEYGLPSIAEYPLVIAANGKLIVRCWGDSLAIL